MNMASKKNIYLIFGALMALLVLFAFVLVNQAVRIKWHSTEIETNWLPSIEAINAMQSAVGNVRSNVVGHILANDESLKDPETIKSKEILFKERGGPKGPEPTRYGDWEKSGRCSDF